MADELTKQNPGAVEVVSLGFIKPLDKEAILKSAKKTGRVLIVQDEPELGGYAPHVRCVLDELPMGSLQGSASHCRRRGSVPAVLGRETVPAVARKRDGGGAGADAVVFRTYR